MTALEVRGRVGARGERRRCCLVGIGFRYPRSGWEENHAGGKWLTADNYSIVINATDGQKWVTANNHSIAFNAN